MNNFWFTFSFTDLLAQVVMQPLRRWLEVVAYQHLDHFHKVQVEEGLEPLQGLEQRGLSLLDLVEEGLERIHSQVSRV
jgi:cytochrome c-type biogenesis protein CcmH/NrfG